MVIQRTWNDGDEVVLTLPMEVRVKRWEQNHNFASVHRGPLTYSLKIGEQYVRHGGNDEWPDWEIHPTTPWNYGLVLDEDDPAASSGSRRTGVSGQRHAASRTTPLPVMLRAKARRIPNWQKDHLGLVGKMQDSPVQIGRADRNGDADSDGSGAAAHQRSAGHRRGAGRPPVAGEPAASPGPDGHAARGQGRAARTASISDTVAALNDRRLPKRLGDHAIPRHTFWPHCGTKEWLQYEFDEPR